MSTVTRARSRRLALTAGLGALALGLAACGSSGDKDPDPAAAVPASAPIYAQVTVRPDGELKSNTESVLKKLGVDDPGQEIVDFLKSSSDDPDDFDDLSWLAPRAGLFFTSFTDDPDFAVVLGTTDPDKAKKSAEEDTTKKASYKDVDYWFPKDDPGSVRGVIDDYAVVGTERAFRTVVDTVKGDADAMTDSDTYKSGLDAVGSDDALATAYLSTEGVLNALGRSGGIPAAQLGQIRQQLTQVGGATSVVKLSPTANTIELDSATLGLKEGAGDSSAATAALAALPQGAWLGVGIPGVGDSLRNLLQQGQQVAATAGQDFDGQLQAIEQGFGIDVEDDLLSWMGDAGLFAQGTSIANIGGALVVQTSNAAKTKATLRKLYQLIPAVVDGVQARKVTGVDGAEEGFEFQTASFPFPIVAAVGNDKFVLSVGKPAASAALTGTSTLADSDAYQNAAKSLGDIKPAFFADVTAFAGLLNGVVPTDDPDTRKVLAALDKLTTIAAGTTRDGSTQRAKLVVGLK